MLRSPVSEAGAVRPARGGICSGTSRRSTPGTTGAARGPQQTHGRGGRGARERPPAAARAEAAGTLLEAEIEQEFADRRASGSRATTSAGEPHEALAAISQALRRAPGRLYSEPGCLSNALESPKFAEVKLPPAGAQAEQAEAPAEGETHGRRRKRGRPVGSRAWNKGLAMPPATRAKISTAQKARWRDPTSGLSAQQRQAQKGRVPWNKGKSLSAETRAKMADAKRHAVYARATRAKMSLAHQGVRHSPETCALLSRKLSGKPKSPEHRAAMAAGQRKRWAATHLLTAIRAHLPPQACSALAEPLVGSRPGAGQAPPPPSDVGPEPPAAPFPAAEEIDPVADSAAAAAALPGGSENLFVGGEAAAGARARGKRRPGAAPAGQNPVVVEEFVAQLRAFRELQQELAPWTEAFRAQRGRKPRVEDVELTRIEWLVSKFKQYVATRDRLLSQSQQLRARLESGGVPLPGSNSYAEPMNANAAGKGAAEGASRIAHAMQYRRALAAAAAESSGHAQLQQQDGAATGSAGAAAPQTGAQQPGCAAAQQPPQAATRQTASAEAIGSAVGLAGAPPRVKRAMLAAAKYRKDKGRKDGPA